MRLPISRAENTKNRSDTSLHPGADCHGFTSRERCDSEQPQMEDKSKFACKGTKNFWDVQIHLQFFRMESPKSYARMGRAEALVAR